MKIKTLELSATEIMYKALWNIYLEDKIDIETYNKVGYLLEKFIKINELFNNTDETFTYEVSDERG